MPPNRSHSLITAIVVLILLLLYADQFGSAQQVVQNTKGSRRTLNGTNHKCSKQSITLAHQFLTYELGKIEDQLTLWLNDLDKDELIEEQRQSLSNMVMSGVGKRLLNSNGQALLDVETSYFQLFAGEERSKLVNSARNFTAAPNSMSAPNIGPKRPNKSGGNNLRLTRRHQNKCLVNVDKQYYTYTFGLSLGPFEHHLDVIYNLPKDLRLSQPIEWRYAQVTILVPRMNYEVVLRQPFDLVEQLDENVPRSIGNDKRTITRESFPFACPPIEIKELTYLPQQAEQLSILSQGLAKNKQTRLQLERLFDDYTRPTVSRHLKEMLRFHLSDKTLPLSA